VQKGAEEQAAAIMATLPAGSDGGSSDSMAGDPSQRATLRSGSSQEAAAATVNPLLAAAAAAAAGGSGSGGAPQPTRDAVSAFPPTATPGSRIGSALGALFGIRGSALSSVPGWMRRAEAGEGEGMGMGVEEGDEVAANAKQRDAAADLAAARAARAAAMLGANPLLAGRGGAAGRE
jgi:hypothetical protein